MFASRFRSHFGWIAFAYAAVIAVVLYPALHESLGPQLTLWNCIPSTLGLIVITSALGKSRRRVIVSATFALLAAALTMFFARRLGLYSSRYRSAFIYDGHRFCFCSSLVAPYRNNRIWSDLVCDTG